MKGRTEVSPPAPDLRANSAPAWKRSLAEAVRDPCELLALLDLPGSLLEAARSAARAFPLVVPGSFIDRMRRGDPDDPLLRQVLPLGAEEVGVEEAAKDGYVSDPIGDGPATLLPGLLQKYEGRVLLIAAGACAVNCRYCFRREYPYGETPRGLEAWRPAIERIAADSTITEVILSGGDPLVLTDPALTRLAEALAQVAHVKRLRIHTRLPIVIPERVTAELIAWLRGTRLTPVVVVHSNHPAELVGACADALERLVDHGVPVLNQAVLLRGVNDDAATLVRLCERLVELRVLPYYLHQLDPVRGAAHFHVSEARGLELVAQLRRKLPGYAVPRYVRDVAGESSKIEIQGGS
jgi:EF-P beta-lysylation protein EpmB